MQVSVIVSGLERFGVSLKSRAWSKKVRIEKTGSLKGPIQKILLLRHGALGDVVVEIPALEAIRLRFPSAQITVLCDPYSGPILEGLPFFNSKLTLHESLNNSVAYHLQLLGLRRHKYDLVIAMRGTGRARVQALLVGGRNRHGYVSTRLGTCMFTSTGKFLPGEHQVMNMLNYLVPLGIEPEHAHPSLSLALDEGERSEAEALLHQSNLGSGPFVVLHPTFSRRPANETWADTNFVHLIERLVQSGLQVVVTSGASELATVERIERACSVPIVNLAGKTSPKVLAAVLERAEAYIGYNTGAMHVAAATNTPVVALFENPGKYVKWRPWTQAPFRILVPELSREFPGGPPLYRADSISPDQVMEALKEVRSYTRVPRSATR